MTVETELAALTKANNDLVSYFNAKKNDIESAVAAAVAAVPNNIKVYYVDSINGNDANNGTLASPKKTIKDAIDRTPSGGSVNVNLLSGTHILDSTINCENKLVVLWGVNSNYANKATWPIIESLGYLGGTGNIVAGKFKLGFKGFLFFNKLNLKTLKVDGLTQNGTLNYYDSAMIATYSSQGQVLMEWVDIELRNAQFISQHFYGTIGSASHIWGRFVDVNVTPDANLDYKTVNYKRQYLVDSGDITVPFPYDLYFGDCSLTGAIDWNAVVNTNKTLIRSNILV